MNMNRIQIRQARLDDLVEIQRIARRTIDRCYRPFLGDEGVDWYLNSGQLDSELSTHLNNCDVLLVDDAIVGFAICLENLIHLMMIDVERHREGLGSQLLAHCERELAKRGHCIGQLETFKGNGQAIAFYLKNKWRITGEQKDEEHDFVRVFFEKQIAE